MFEEIAEMRDLSIHTGGRRPSTSLRNQKASPSDDEKA